MAALAGRQHGVVALLQLLALGLSERAVWRRVAAGRLHIVHRGVLAVGHTALTIQGRRLAAVLACGPGAVVSHRSAAAAWGLLDAHSGAVDVMTSRTASARTPGVRVHRPRRLPAEDVTTRDGIPITIVERTLLDLAGLLSAQALARAVHEAAVLRVYDAEAMARVLGAANGRRGAARLRALVAEETVPTKNELERRFRALCRRHGLPMPETNVRLRIPGGRWEVDALWRPARLIVELDGAAVHHTRRAFETDRVRDVALLRAGYLVVRITWRRLRDEPEAVVADVRDLLHSRGGCV